MLIEPFGASLGKEKGCLHGRKLAGTAALNFAAFSPRNLSAEDHPPMIGFRMRPLRQYHAFILLVCLGTAGTPAASALALLSRQVYVWQHDWNASVRDAVEQRSSLFDRVILLAAEISWKGTNRECAEIWMDQALLRGKTNFGLAIRINSHKGPFDSATISDLVRDIGKVIANAEKQGFVPAEIQIDYDSPESRLLSFRDLLRAIHQEATTIPLTITALPSWLYASGFAELVSVTSGYVLQVHSLEAPRDISAPYILCDPVAAKRAVARATQFGKPFRIALPTYSYLLAFNPEGKFVGLSAEGPARTWPPDTRLRVARSDPQTIAPLVAEWLRSPPEHCQGLIWYRLPVASDRLNWTWPTLAAVISGRTPKPKLEPILRRPQPRLVEIDLANRGDDDVPLPGRFILSAANARFEAGDGLQGYEARERNNHSWIFTRTQPDRLLPAETRMAGWVRLDKTADVQVEISKNTGEPQE